MTDRISFTNPTEMLEKLVDDHLNDVIEFGQRYYKQQQISRKIDDVRKTYLAYLQSVIDRYSQSKSFFIRTPQFLYDFYVPLSIVAQRKRLDLPTITELSEISRFLTISGLAGSGKSMFMRHLLLDAISRCRKIPVFVELRQLNQLDAEKVDLEDTILACMSANKFVIDNHYLQAALQAGHFIILLDGLDEVNGSKQKVVISRIQQMARDYDQNWYIVSSRPDPALHGWDLFANLTLAPLTIDQAIELVEKIPFDEDIKERFRTELKKDLFRLHQSFLSNPLLLSIMLLTYQESASIPNKLNTFYAQAYTALFQKHDALKGGYQRERKTKLDIQEFSEVFSLFCLQSYDEGKFEFTRLDAIEYLEKIRTIVKYVFDSEAFLADALQAVSLLAEDGLLIVFAHRSFQEYFAARFISKASQKVQAATIKKYSKNVTRDNVMKLLYEMAPTTAERHYLIPMHEKLMRKIQYKRSVGITHYFRYLRAVLRTVIIMRPPGRTHQTGLSFTVVAAGQELLEYCFFVLNNCAHLTSPESVEEIETEESFAEFVPEGSGSIELPITSVGQKSRLFRLLARTHGPLSLQGLRRAIEIGHQIQSRHLQAEESILELIK